MDKLENFKLNHLLPSSIAADATVKNISSVAEKLLQNVAKQTAVILLLPHLDELPEAVVDELAWQYHVDTYNTDFAIDVKRQLIRQSIVWHHKKGTPAAVTDMLSTIYASAQLEECWEYGGEPYHFRVTVGEDRTDSAQTIDDAIRVIKLSKNVRSWLDGIKFRRNLTGALYTGAALAKNKRVELFAHTELATNSLYVGGVIMRNRRQQLPVAEAGMIGG